MSTVAVDLTRKEINAFRKIKKITSQTNRQLKGIKKDCDRSNPVDMDIIKTTKAMYYEQVIEVLRSIREE